MSTAHAQKLFVGRRFSRWEVAAILPREGNNRKVECVCDCGTKKVVYEASLVSGKSTSCGCFRSEHARESKTTHGESRARSGLPSTEYKTWKEMISRCSNQSNKAYRHYGARGISVCKEWVESFDAFLFDMGRKPSCEYSIDRINNNGNYEPANCRWATRQEQSENTTRTRRVFLNGEVMTITKAARIMGVHTATASKRLAA